MAVLTVARIRTAPKAFVPCPLCSGAPQDVILSRTAYPGVPLTNVICRGCGLIRITPRMSSEWYEAFYRTDFFEYLDPYHRPSYVEEIEHTTDEATTSTKRTILPFVLPYVKPQGRVLDIGAGFGQLLYLLGKEKQIIPVGLEPDPGSRQIAQERMGLTLLPETIEQFLLDHSERFDFMILNQVFEHFLEPVRILQDLATRLEPEGVIYIGVPNGYDPQCSMSLFYQVAHTFNYTPHTLGQIAARAGLRVVALRDSVGSLLEVLLAPSASSYPSVSPEILLPGSSWRDVVDRLGRKQRWNMVRGFAKRVLGVLMPAAFVDALRKTVDRIIGYRY